MIGKRLKGLRASKNLTQNDVVKILQCSHNKYASWEQERTEPDIESIKELCKIFEISADFLLGIEDEFGNKINDGNTVFSAVARSKGNTVKEHKLTLTPQQIKTLDELLENLKNNK